MSAPSILPAGRDLARYIDHTLLSPGATRDEVAKLCAEAREWGFATVCVRAGHVALAASLLRGCSSRPIAVVDFPRGNGGVAAKVNETREVVEAGAAEVDMVVNLEALKLKDYALVEQEIRAVVEAARPALVKVILETAALTRDEKAIGCALSKAAGAAFVKTSTGFGPGGATLEDVALLRAIVGEDMGVKASGGIRTAADAGRMIAAGASRLGTSASVAIVSAAVASGALRSSGES